MLSFQAATTEMQEWMKTTLATTGPRLGLFTSTSTLTVRREQLGLALTRDQVRQKQVSATKYSYKQCTFTLVCIGGDLAAGDTTQGAEEVLSEGDEAEGEDAPAEEEEEEEEEEEGDNDDGDDGDADTTEGGDEDTTEDGALMPIDGDTSDEDGDDGDTGDDEDGGDDGDDGDTDSGDTDDGDTDTDTLANGEEEEDDEDEETTASDSEVTTGEHIHSPLWQKYMLDM